MDKKDRIFVIGMVCVVIGSLIGILLTAGMVWADLEAMLFIFGLEGDESTNDLDCPVLMTTNETREVSLTLKNPGENVNSPYVIATISEGYFTLTRNIKQEVKLDPGEKKKVSWEIFPEDAAYQRIVLFKVYVRQSYPYPSLKGNCGVLVLDVPLLKGKQVMALALGLTFVMILGGNAILQYQYRNAALGPSRQYMSKAMYIMSILIALGILISYLGYWLGGLILLFIILIMIVILILQVAL
ncbi:MAG: hypothetical protein R6U57_10495 [Anaerolineales bacterium]